MSLWQAHKEKQCNGACWYCQHPPSRDPKRQPLAVSIVGPVTGKLVRAEAK